MNKNKSNVIQVSFKENVNDKLLYSWLECKFDEFGGKSNYIKYVLKKEMEKEIEAKQ